MQEIYNIVASMDFNRPEDREHFGTGNKMISLNCFTQDDIPVIGLSFDLGAEPDDRMYLILPLEELMVKLVKAIFEAAH